MSRPTQEPARRPITPRSAELVRNLMDGHKLTPAELDACMADPVLVNGRWIQFGEMTADDHRTFADEERARIRRERAASQN